MADVTRSKEVEDQIDKVQAAMAAIPDIYTYAYGDSGDAYDDALTLKREVQKLLALVFPVIEQVNGHRVGDRVRIGRGHVLWIIVDLYHESLMAKVRNNYIGVGGEQFRTVALDQLTNLSALLREEKES